MYADDVQLYVGRTGLCARELVGLLNEDLGRIFVWSQRNKLFINHAKSKALLLRGRQRNAGRTDLLPRVLLDGQPLEWTESASNLGFVFQADLQWDGLISQQCGKIYAGLRTLHTCTTAAPFRTRMKLFKALILPHFLFGDLLHVHPNARDFDRLRVALNCCVRYVYGLGRRAHVSHLQSSLLGCPLRSLYAYRSCLFLRKLMSSRSPPSLYGKLTASQGLRLQNLVVPANSTNSYANSLFVRGVVHWNSLPPAVKRSNSEAIFKRGCLQFFNQ